MPEAPFGESSATYLARQKRIDMKRTVEAYRASLCTYLDDAKAMGLEPIITIDSVGIQIRWKDEQ